MEYPHRDSGHVPTSKLPWFARRPFRKEIAVRLQGDDVRTQKGYYDGNLYR